MLARLPPRTKDTKKNSREKALSLNPLFPEWILKANMVYWDRRELPKAQLWFSLLLFLFFSIKMLLDLSFYLKSIKIFLNNEEVTQLCSKAGESPILCGDKVQYPEGR